MCAKDKNFCHVCRPGERDIYEEPELPLRGSAKLESKRILRHLYHNRFPTVSGEGSPMLEKAAQEDGGGGEN